MTLFVEKKDNGYLLVVKQQITQFSERKREFLLRELEETKIGEIVLNFLRETERI